MGNNHLIAALTALRARLDDIGPGPDSDADPDDTSPADAIGWGLAMAQRDIDSILASLAHPALGINFVCDTKIPGDEVHAISRDGLTVFKIAQPAPASVADERERDTSLIRRLTSELLRVRTMQGAAAHALDVVRQRLGLDLIDGEHPSDTARRITAAADACERHAAQEGK